MPIVIKATQIKKYYGEREVLSFDELSVQSGDKIGVVGLNGAGKSTLLHILSGEIEPDEGSVERRCAVAYLRQFSSEEITADPKLLSLLGVRDKTKAAKVSGGEHTRLKIAGALSAAEGGAVLFADEPTANLDISGVQMLTEQLRGVETLLLISHDRALLDALCTQIIEVRGGKLHVYPGNFSAYHALRQAERGREWAEYERYAQERARLSRVYEAKKLEADTATRRPKNISAKEYNLRNFLSSRPSDVKQKNMHRNAKAVLERIEQLEVKEKPREVPPIRLDFSLTDPPANKLIFTGERLSFSYGERVIFKNASFTVPNRAKIALVGENGAGKTTLLNLIANGHPAIKVAPKANIGYFYQGFESLDMGKSVLENVMEGAVQDRTAARTILARLLLSGEEVHKPVSVLSGGERIKAQFAKLFVSSANVLLLDEPTNYLDMPSIEALQEILRAYEGTVVFVSHDRAFVNAAANRLLLVEGQRLAAFEGNLEAYERMRAAPKKRDDTAERRMLLELRRTRLLSQLSAGADNARELEAALAEIEAQIKQIK